MGSEKGEMRVWVCRRGTSRIASIHCAIRDSDGCWGFSCFFFSFLLCGVDLNLLRYDTVRASIQDVVEFLLYE